MDDENVGITPDAGDANLLDSLRPDGVVAGEATSDVELMAAHDQEVETQQVNARRKKRQRLTAVGAVAVVLIVSLVAVGISGPGTSDAAAQVELGARTTLAAHSAAIVISGSVSVDGQSIPITGSGYTDPSTGIVDANFQFSSDGTTINESELSDGSGLYMQIMSNGQNEISHLLPGKTWVELPLNTSSGVGAGTTNVLTQLQILTQQGNTVTSLGTSTVDGVSATGYQVTLSTKAMAAAAKRVEKATGFNSQQVKSAIAEFSKNPPVLKLWLDANHLLVREEVSLSATLSGSSASVDVAMDFTKYGQPITVTIPSASDVGSYSAFIAAAQNAS